MNRQKQYLADNVDAMGNVFPTVGENIRNGAKSMNIEGVTNIRLLYINIDGAGNITFSENIDCLITKYDDRKNCRIILPTNVCCSSPIMIISKSNNYNARIYDLCTSNYNGRISLEQCTYDTTAVFIIGDNARY